ncbi:MAG: Ger(x)C family spore germination protein [Betaproteobacteria bacterium]
MTARVRLFRLLWAAALSAVLATAGGCWDAREIETLGFVMALGIDQAPNRGKFTVTAAIALPKQLQTGGGAGQGTGGGSGRGEEPPRWIVTGTGDTIFEAIRSLHESSPRRIFLGHTQLFIIGEDLCRQGVGPVEEFFNREKDVRRTVGLLAAEGPAQPIIEAAPRLERVLSLTYTGIERWNPVSSTAHVVPLREQLYEKAAEGQELASGRILLTSAKQAPKPSKSTMPTEFPGVGAAEAAEGQQGQQGEQGRQGQTGTASPAEEAQKKPEILIAGMAAFKGDRLVGWLNRQETRGYLFIRNRPVRGSIVITAGTDKPVKVALESKASRTTTKVVMRRGRPEIQLKVRWNGNIAEVMGSLDVTRQEVMEQIQRRAATAIRSDMLAALKRAQKELKTDIFGFGAKVRRAHPREWARLKKDWDTLYPEVEVAIQVEAKVRRVGVVTKPLRPR